MTTQDKLDKQEQIDKNFEIIDAYLFGNVQDDDLRRKAIKALIHENMDLIDLRFNSAALASVI
ncbi:MULTISPECIES: hypothetical protein [Paenibacillus]|uniref:hypothetical protein n=1 Tax=Paenibacillus TaxID=44249 RepID=UPI0008998B8A|nr:MULTISPECIES: hypothetical protein [Paenibacillus]MCZ1268419.1 hypothetical protein [Paenibacillus tundrae]SEB27529.1 hypothetical protein SAMN03159332_6192 [Paenibacillus sp. 276b]SLK16573.1 hypothetical protein SAMN06272722_110196 [Paenibacillus sp. RU5A]SOC74410.1 hypothetical protein SAMN05880581_110196 [Paenibacillus sp. RU26A]SOC76569.1 hypothetical protein SAMN05880586_110196 [Paenibacillus sp. RU5M]